MGCSAFKPKRRSLFVQKKNEESGGGHLQIFGASHISIPALRGKRGNRHQALQQTMVEHLMVAQRDLLWLVLHAGILLILQPGVARMLR